MILLDNVVEDLMSWLQDHIKAATKNPEASTLLEDSDEDSDSNLDLNSDEDAEDGNNNGANKFIHGAAVKTVGPSPPISMVVNSVYNVQKEGGNNNNDNVEELAL